MKKYHLLFCLFLSCLGRLVCDEKNDVEESKNIGEHHKENWEMKEYPLFVSRVVHETLLYTNTWIEVGILV